MPRPYAWTRLRNEGHVVVSPRSGHTLTATSVGFVLYGGMDGRRNDLGNPAPNSDLYILELGPKGTFKWNGVEIDAGSQTPPVRTLHSAVAVSSDELFVFGGIHSTTPYQALNDGWTLDTTCFEWRRCQFKTAKPEHRGSFLRRMTGKIPEYLQELHSNKANPIATASSFQRKTNAAASSGITFESLAMAASRAVSDRATLAVGGQGSMSANLRPSINGVEGSNASSWGKKAWKKILAKKQGMAAAATAGSASVAPSSASLIRSREMKLRKQQKAQASSLMASEEEQFHDDILKMVTMGSNNNAAEDAVVAATTMQLPAPRANHSTSLYENSLVLFGGHGGLGYQRRAFNDVWTLNLDNNRWVELSCRGNPPAPRSGHASFQKDGIVFIFGGWNSETQFNDLFALDVENKDWADLDLQWGVPRWNMAVQLVEAIPSWRAFIFGGSADRLSEGRSMGMYDRSIGVLDLGEELRWDSPTLEERQKDEKPPGREHTAICYDSEDSRLIIFGGWSNKWLDDCWQINVSSIVGPPYAIVAVRPPLGPVSGLQKIQVLGVGFLSTPGSVTVRFVAAGGRHMQEAQGVVIDDELIECTTPNVIGSIGPRECEVRVQIGCRDFTTTVTDYHYFLNTVAEKSLCYGPGLLNEQQSGQQTRFRIQARNELGENRKSGRDEWAVQVQQKIVAADGRETFRDLPFEVEDFDTGQYEVRYLGEVGEVLIHVRMQDEHGKHRPVRGSPYKSTHVQYAKTSANDYLGASVHSWLMNTLQELEHFNRTTEEGLKSRIRDDDVKGLIKVMNHIQELERDEDNLIRKQDEVVETLAHLERKGVPIDKQMKMLKKIGTNLEHLKAQSHQVNRDITPTVQSQKEVYRKRIAEFEAELREYQRGLKREAYYVYVSGIELAFSKLAEVTGNLDQKATLLEELMHIATNFEYPEELTRSRLVVEQMRDEVAIVRALWDYEVGRIQMTEEFLVKRWCEVKADEMEDDIKASLKKLRETKVDKKLDVYLGMQKVVKDWTVFCPLVAELRDPSMRPRHWSALMGICGKSLEVTEDMLLRDVWNMELHKFQTEVQDLGEQAKQEAQMEAKLSKLANIWSGVEFEMEPHKGTDVSLLSLTEEHVDTLEENQVEVQNMFALRFLATFETEVLDWQRTLASITEVSGLLSEVQRTWVFLENLFIHSEEVRKELPEESDSFVGVDFDVKQLLRRGAEVRTAKSFCCEPGIFEALEKAQVQLQVCEKALNEFMDGKRRAFPRFFFMSSADLLDVLSNGNNPARVVPLFPKFFNAIERYDLEYPREEEAVKVAKERLKKEIQDVDIDAKTMRVVLKKKIDFVEFRAEFFNPKAATEVLHQVAIAIAAANQFLSERGEATFRLRIGGHIDEPNQELSFARAKAVKDVISKKTEQENPSLRNTLENLFIAEGHSDDIPLPGREKNDRANNRIEILMIAEGGKEGRRGVATGMHACIGKEFVPFPEHLPMTGKVEVYLERCIGAFRSALRHFTKQDLAAYFARKCPDNGEARGQWLLGVKAAQCGLLVQLIAWVQLVEGAFKKAVSDEKPDPNAPADAWERQKNLLLSLIKLTMTNLTKPDRQKLMCAITLDAHNRDVQGRLVSEKVIRVDAFQWQSMLKSYWEEDESNARMCICDATLEYAYEYLGNGGRLVVTPLTDRIYVTATQALHLCMGCAPAGPAGTGKTESTKDLANALARACYVINAAPEMDYVTLGNIFKGLAASGSWGCFDEFNRLVPEVLSVCTVQFKAVCDALRKRSKRFIIQGDEMILDRGVGVFITMNPGYLGRSELPEGLKALFRPITVMVPDFMLIMENMFMSEGFLEAKELALKFATLYALNKDLLSKSNKYDWGMRAIKSVLVVAGGFKRADTSLPEAAVLMRSLRDTNVAKIEGDDLKIFMGLLGDLFPGVEVPRARDFQFEKVLVETMEEDFGYTNDEHGYLLLKITQLVELLAIRHSVFLMGNPGSFKSSMWKVLRNAKTKSGEKTTVVDFSPKAITTNELYGSVNMATREWKDGILSKTMRDLGLIPDTLPKWIMLDGDLDANWIESMNSVMDDSRLLTLPSNERIPLKPHMKMIFEIRDLNYATPATATRAGIVCMSDTDGVQWKSYMTSWIRKLVLPEKLEAEPLRRSSPEAAMTDNDVREFLSKLFEKYCPDTLKWMSKSAKIQVPMVEVSFISVVCSLLDALFSGGIDTILPSLEYWFVFCVVYAIGGCLAEIDGTDYRKQFSNWWKNEMKTIKYPSNGLVFDYFVREGKLEDWTNMSELKEKVEYRSSTPMGEVTVPTSETVATNYFMKALIKAHHPVMLIGLAGCGKTQSCAGMLQQLCQPSLEGTQFTFHKMNMSYYTDSTLLQTMMEIPLEKKTGKRFAPPGKLHLIYFIDDLNMPALDKYNTQSAIELIKQKQDYDHWYDRNKIQLKEIVNTQYLCCMNPTAGSFTVNPRLQRHFWTCAVPFPKQSALSLIYSTFMEGHMKLPFKVQVQELSSAVIKAALTLHNTVSNTFRKTAKNMHYEFNIRHMSGVFAGMLQAQPKEFADAEKFVLLWVHESERIYGDRLVSVTDLRKYRTLVGELSKKMFSKFNFSRYFQEKNPEPLVFAPFAKGLAEMAEGPCYDKIKDIDRLFEILTEAMAEYDATNPAMDLVLFEDAMKHVAKICRIISRPSGHPLLVGVGGSGRQSLSRLSAFVCQCVTTMIVISSTYGLFELKSDLQKMYKKAGEKDEGVMFLFTDNQIANERFLVFFNDLLASGEITDLFPSEDKDAIRNSVRGACKAEGIADTPDNLWNFYLSRVRKNLHMSLCFSPVGDGMWSRARKFPALVNCTVIDWFQPWPMDALQDVAAKFLSTVEQLGPPDSELRQAFVDFFPFSFEAVNGLSQTFIQQERRFAYTTPKSFLELIKLYTLMLGRNVGELSDKKQRLSAGLVKLVNTSEQVSKLEEELKEKAVVVKEKMQIANEKAEEVGLEEAKIRSEADKAKLEEQKCQTISKQVAQKKEECTREVEKALPLVHEAEAALDVLKKEDFQELKTASRPPAGVDTVCECTLHLLAGIDPNVDVDKKGRLKDTSWKASQKMMTDPAKFLTSLKSYKDHVNDLKVPQNNVEEARKKKDALGDQFSMDVMKKKSQAAGGLCQWVINIIKYFDVVMDTEPKRRSLLEAEETLKQANQRMDEVQQLVNALKEKLEILEAEFQKANADKEAVLAEAEKCQKKLTMANRLINALSANGVLWKQIVERIDEDLVFIPGDSVVACSFASYLGVFTREYREQGTAKFIEFLREHEVPLGPQPEPLEVLSTEAERALWCTKGLPSDRFSLENGAIMTNSERWCLMVDPQAQGIVWVKHKEADQKLIVTRMGHAKMVHEFEKGIQGGRSVLIENMGEQIDAVLQPVIARNYIKRASKLLLKIGDKEIIFNPRFRLFMQTKLSNPHYPPEIQAECTIINFTVTESGLEEQLLFLVVKLERPDLARQKSEVIQQQNEFKVRLAELEAQLLEKLSSAEGDILEDHELIQSLEDAKATSDEVKEKVVFAQELETRINGTSENYRDAANRGALLFFLMMDLAKMHTFYKYSLDAFVMVVSRAVGSLAMARPDSPSSPELVLNSEADKIVDEGDEDERERDDEFGDEEQQAEEREVIFDLSGAELVQRVLLLKGVITAFVFSFLRRGLLDADKLTVASMLALRILVRAGDIIASELSLLIRAPLDPSPPPLPDGMRSWLTETQWAQLKALEQLSAFKTSSTMLTQAVEQDSLGWKRWFAEERAEAVDLPRGCRDIGPFHRLFLLRVLRPDRIGAALLQFVVDNLGSEYVEQAPFSMALTYEESSRLTPIFFVLFPGTDPTPMVEAQAVTMGLTEANGKFVNISMGQGQEQVASAALHHAAKEGGWVMLQNIHLMQAWLKALERNLELLEEFSQPDFRCILTSEPPSTLQGPMWEVIPESILQKCIKIADEAPTDLKSNLRRAWSKFDQSNIDACHKPEEFKATLFALCFFHSLILGRIKFGPQGWSKKYPFNDGDLTICGQVLCNYLNNAEKQHVDVPWPDIRYIFGEIMYGGHITDFWDRRVNNTYLAMLIQPELLSAALLCKGFKSPDPKKYEYGTYTKHIEDRFPPEAPELFSLHPNAEIGYLTNQGFAIFRTVQGISGSDVGANTTDISSSLPILSKYLEELPADLDMLEIRGRLRDEDYTPYVISSLQESDRMNLLLQRIRNSLQELELGIGGQLNVTENMEKLADALQLNQVADSWRQLAYPSLKPLGTWFADVLKRVEQLTHWTVANNGLLLSTWLSGLFNPMAFLTAVMQVTARDRGMPLDFMTNRTTFLNTMDPNDFLGLPASGVHIHGLFMEGASWEEGKGDDEGYITVSKMKELHAEMPVANVYSVLVHEMSWENMYHCPVFMTAERGATFVTEVNVRMDRDDDERGWILAGAALVLTDDDR